MLNIKTEIATMNKPISDDYLLKAAEERMEHFQPDDVISQSDILRELGITEEELNSIDVEIEGDERNDTVQTDRAIHDAEQEFVAEGILFDARETLDSLRKKYLA